MTLTTEVTPLDGNRAQLDLAVPPEEVKRQFGLAVKKIGRNMKVPGFRPGRIPEQVILQRVGREAVLDEMLRDAVGEWWGEAVAESGVRPITEPEFEQVEDVPEDGTLNLRATVELRPTATLGDYKGLEVGRAEPEIPEGALDEQLEELRKRAARLVTVDRAAANGDFALIDFDGSIGGARVRNASARDYLVEVGAGKLMNEFDRRLVGMAAGDDVSFDVEYGGDDRRAELRGKTVQYTVTVKQVQESQLPELDDDLAIEVSEFDTMDELRADLTKKLEDAAEERVQEDFRRRVIDAVTENATVEVPKAMIDNRVGTILHRTQHGLPEGVSLEDFLAASGKTIPGVAEELAPDAEMALKRELVVEAVADAEGIEVTDADVENQVRDDAAETGKDAESLLRELREADGVEALREDLRLQRAMELLVTSSSAIPLRDAEAREALWTPESEVTDPDAGKLWTPGDPGDPRKKTEE